MSSTFASIVANSIFSADQLNAVTDAQIKSIEALFENIVVEDSDIKGLSIFDPEVYDPAIVGRHLARVYEEHKSNGAEAKFGEGLKLLIGAQVKKGSITEKNFSRLSEANKQTVADLMRSYRISAKLTTGTKKTAVTLQRLAGGLPIVTCQIALKLGVKHGGEYGSGELPGAMQCQAFACLIPTGSNAVTLFLRDAIMCFCCDNTLRIGGTNSTELWGKQLVYVEAMRSSRTVDDNARIGVLKTLGISTAYSEIAACLVKAKKPVVPEADFLAYF